MMEKDKLRKADIFSGSAIFLAGIYIVSQALQMPMKDSWGGVQNVWYVSPAIFPLLVGCMIMLLGALLIRTAIKEIGLKAMKSVGNFFTSPEFIQFLKLDRNIRFYAILTILFSFIYLFIPRIDFFLAAVEFLLVFISIFHLEDEKLLIKLFLFYTGQVVILILFFITGLNTLFSSYFEYAADILALILIVSFVVYLHRLCKSSNEFKKRFRTSLIVAIAAPVIIGMTFKYFLLVPMPYEGMVIALVDHFWYL